MPEPQLEPSGALPAVVQTAVPELQEYDFFTQGVDGSVQSMPAGQATH
jgi:hypothetical protein